MLVSKWERAKHGSSVKQQGCACMFVITRMDAENAQFDEVVSALQETFRSGVYTLDAASGKRK